MKRKISLILSAAFIIAVMPMLVPAAVPVALGATHSFPSSAIQTPDNLVGDPIQTHANWVVGGVAGLTAEMLQNANKLVVTTSHNSNITLYANSPLNSYWDPSEVNEFVRSGVATFNLEWKRDIWASVDDASGITLGDWGTAWSTLRGRITNITLHYNNNREHADPFNLGTVNSATFGETTKGRIRELGTSVITAADVTLVRTYLATSAPQRANFASANRMNLDNADVNGDGIIDAKDIALMRQYIAATNPGDVPTGAVGNRQPLPRNFSANTKLVNLTFDDGPVVGPSSMGNTGGIAAALASCVSDGVAARATFFSQGQKVTPGVVPMMKRMHDIGHDWENHTFGHGDIVFGGPWSGINYSSYGFTEKGDQKGAMNVGSFSAREFEFELKVTNKLIEDAVGRKPKYFRYPQFEGGLHSAAVNAEGLYVIHTAQDSRDFNSTTVQQIIDVFVGTTDRSIDGTPVPSWNSDAGKGFWDGKIILLHDAGGTTSQNSVAIRSAEAILDYVPKMQEAGYVFVTTEELWTIRNKTPASGGSGASFNGIVTGQNVITPEIQARMLK